MRGESTRDFHRFMTDPNPTVNHENGFVTPYPKCRVFNSPNLFFDVLLSPILCYLSHSLGAACCAVFSFIAMTILFLFSLAISSDYPFVTHHFKFESSDDRYGKASQVNYAAIFYVFCFIISFGILYKRSRDNKNTAAMRHE